MADLFSTSAYRIDGMHQETSSTHDAASQFQPNNVAIHTPALNAVVVAVDEGDEQPIQTLTWRDRARSAKSFAAIVAFGLVLGSLGLLDAHGQLHGKTLAHAARVGGLNTIRYVLSAEETLGLKEAPRPSIEVRELDADWTPPPFDAKPWTPKPYAAIQPPTSPAADAPAPIVNANLNANTTKHKAKSKKSSRAKK